METPEEVQRGMRDEWNERAREDAHYYVAFGRRDQPLDEFLSTASDVIRNLEAELPRLGPGDRRNRRALEIGCGPGRLMLPMSWNFGEVHGVDVSDEMIRLALRNVRRIPNAFPRPCTGRDLADFPDQWFDFVYSYAVFQHIPSRDVVMNYLAEAHRVLKPDGILRCQINGLPKSAAKYTTWSGVRIGAGEIADFAAAHDMQLLGLEGFDTQYMWTTMRKRTPGWFASLTRGRELQTRVRNVVNALTGAPAVPAEGRHASFSLWVEHLPLECDLNTIGVIVDGVEAAPVFIGHPGPDGLTQINALLPKGARTGLLPVELLWMGEPLGEAERWMRVIPAPPRIPRVLSIGDGVNLMNGDRIASGVVKICLEEVAAIEGFEAKLDGQPVDGVDTFCTDPLHERYEVNLTLPDGTRPGRHQLRFALGTREFAPAQIEVAG